METPMEEYNLEPIVEYSMTPDETAAYKIGILWIEISKRLFPELKRVGSFPKRGDPRKGSLFKHCYKLYTLTKGLIDIKDYKFYVAAQLQIFKAIEISGQHPFVSPACLIGDKAWVRWKIWKKKYENINKVKKVEDVDIQIDISEIQKELIKTKKFTDSKFLNEEEFKNVSADISRAIMLGKISGFYAVLSPWVKKYCILGDIDLTYYQDNANSHVVTYFKELFKDEFQC
jgi:hypothetical protein